MNFFLATRPLYGCFNNAESVKPNFVYLMRGCGIPCSNKRYDAPHSIWMQDITAMLCRHPYKMMSAVRCPITFENCYIFYRGQCENTFLCLCAGAKTCDATKIAIFHKQTTLGGTPLLFVNIQAIWHSHFGVQQVVFPTLFWGVEI